MEESDEKARSVSGGASDIAASMEDQLENVEPIVSSVDRIAE